MSLLLQLAAADDIAPRDLISALRSGWRPPAGAGVGNTAPSIRPAPATPLSPSSAGIGPDPLSTGGPTPAEAAATSIDPDRGYPRSDQVTADRTWGAPATRSLHGELRWIYQVAGSTLGQREQHEALWRWSWETYGRLPQEMSAEDRGTLILRYREHLLQEAA